MDGRPTPEPPIDHLESLQLDTDPRPPHANDVSSDLIFSNAMASVDQPAPPGMAEIFHVIIGRIGYIDLFDWKSLHTLRLLNRGHYELITNLKPHTKAHGCAADLEILWQCTEFLSRIETLTVTGYWPKYYQQFLSGFRLRNVRELTLDRHEDRYLDESESDDEDDKGSTGNTDDYSYSDDSYNSEEEHEHSGEWVREDEGSTNSPARKAGWMNEQEKEIHRSPGRLGCFSQLLRHGSFPALVSLRLTTVTSAILETFASLPHWPLKELFVTGKGPSKTIVGTNALVSIFDKYTELKTLSLISIGIIRNPKKNRRLRRETLPLLERVEIHHVTGFYLLNGGRAYSTPAWSNLKSLKLQPDDVNELFDLSHASWLRNLKSLALDNGYKRCDVQYNGCSAVLQALRGCDIEEISLALWQINEMYCSSLDLPKLKKFQWRQFSPVVVSLEFDIGSLAASTLPSLEIIDFEPRVTVYNFIPLVTSLPTSFKKLILHKVAIRPEDIKVLFLDIMPKLEECSLDLQGNNEVLENILQAYQEELPNDNFTAPKWPLLSSFVLHFIDTERMTCDSIDYVWRPESKAPQLMQGARKAGHLPRLQS